MFVELTEVVEVSKLFESFEMQIPMQIPVLITFLELVKEPRTDETRDI